MPFTLSHPAAVVPFRRRGWPLSALAIGSMAPDLPYFVLPSGTSEFSHSLPGLFLVALPAGLVVFWLFQLTLKFPLLSLLPKSHRQRLEPVAAQFHYEGWRQLLTVALAVLFGAFTHIAWDFLTHYYGWESIAHSTDWSKFAPRVGINPEHFPDFRQPLYKTPFGPIFINEVTQYGSSLLGIVLLAYWYSRWFPQAEERSLDSRFQFPDDLRRRALTVMVGVLVLTFIVAWVGCYLGIATHNINGWIKCLRQVVIISLKVLIAELLIYSVLWHRWERRGRQLGQKLF